MFIPCYALVTHGVEVLAEQSYSSNLSKSAVRWENGFSKLIEQLKRYVYLQTMEDKCYGQFTLTDN